MENPYVDRQNSSSSTPSVQSSIFKKRVQDVLARHETDRQLRRKERQSERLRGHLTEGVVSNLRNCTIEQLRKAKKLCDQYIRDQRKPPAPSECGGKFVVKVIDSVCVNSRRFQLEFRRSTLAAKRVYVNGPYIRAYHRDGAIIKVEPFRRKDKELSKKLPRKVWTTFRDKLNDPALESERKVLTEKIND